MSCGTEDVDNFVLVEFFESITSRTEVLAGVKFCRFFIKDFTDSSGHSETAVGVDVDFANCGFSSFAELTFVDTDSIFEFSAVFVDDLDEVLGNGGGSMENDGESGDLLFDFVEDVKTDFGIGTGLEFVSTMAGSDCDSEGVNTCLSEECFGLTRK